MDLSTWAAGLIVAASVTAVFRGLDVRAALLAGAFALAAVGGTAAPVVRKFLETFSNEKFVVPICAAMGFAYVLKHTGCDRHLVRLLVAPVRRVRFLLVPGVVLVGFVVNVPVISQSSTVVCLGPVVIPIMRAAGFRPRTIGATLLLGTSVGGELLNPAAPELLTVREVMARREGVTLGPDDLLPRLSPLVFTMLGVSAAVLWGVERLAGRKGFVGPAVPDASTEERTAQPDLQERVNPFKAAVPLLPLAVLFVTGPPLQLLTVPSAYLSADPASASTRLIGLAMLVGVLAAAAVSPRKAGGCMAVFWEGAGYGFTHVVSLIVIANCFGVGIEQSGLAAKLGGLIAAEPALLQPLAVLLPTAFGAVCGSGMATTQSLYEFFHVPAVALGVNPLDVGTLVAVGSAAGRTMSPVAAVTLMTATLTGTRPGELVVRVAPPLFAGLAAVIALRLAGGL